MNEKFLTDLLKSGEMAIHRSRVPDGLDLAKDPINVLSEFSRSYFEKGLLIAGDKAYGKNFPFGLQLHPLQN